MIKIHFYKIGELIMRIGIDIDEVLTDVERWRKSTNSFKLAKK